MFIAGLRISVNDKRSKEERARKTGIMVAAPHSSHFDFGSMLAIGPKTPVAKKEDLWNPLIGCQLILSSGILVKRNDEQSRQEVIREIGRRSLLEEVGLFSEATVTNGSSLIQFKPGAFIPGLPILPCLVKYHWDGTINKVTWTWKSPGLPLLWLLTCSSWSTTSAVITFLPIYHPSEEEKRNPIVFAENVRRHMAAELEVPCSRYSFEEAFFVDWATKAKISLSPASLKFAKLTHKICKQLNALTSEGEACNGNENGNGVHLNGGDSSTISARTTKPINGEKDTKVTKSKNKAESVRLSHQQVFKQIINDTTNWLNEKDDFYMSKIIESHLDLAHVLKLPKGVEALKLKAAMIDFYQSLKLDLNSKRMTPTHLLLFLKLVNATTGGIWDRIECFIKTCKGNTFLSPKESLHLLIWYLLGIEQAELDGNILSQFEFSLPFIQDNLRTTFHTAVEDTCAHLLV